MRAKDALTLITVMENRIESLVRAQEILKKKGSIDHFDHIERELIRLRVEHARRLDGADLALGFIKDPMERTVVRLRYVQGLRADEIADTVGYCERQIYRIIKKGVETIEKSGFYENS